MGITPPSPADEWAPCSDRSRERCDPLSGSGGFGARWLLVEIDGSWGEHAFLDSYLGRELGWAIVRRAERAGLRPVAIRRLGRRADERRAETQVRWAIADSRPGHESMHWGAVDDPAELTELPLDGSAGVASEEPAILVCTHARHDRCCAVRGRPVAAELTAAHPEATWECSHLGGDRFAATMILLPHGLYYGRVPAAVAPSIMEEYRQARVVPEYFRGRSSLSNATQAAQAFARDTFGDLGIQAWAPLREEHHAEEASWSIDLAHGDDTVRVEMQQTWSEPLLSTCEAVRPAPVRQFALESVTHGPSEARDRQVDDTDQEEAHH